MAVSRKRRFCLLADLPLSVVSKGVTYSLAAVPVPVSDQWHFSVRWPGGHWLIAYAGSRAALQTKIYTEGIEFQSANVARTVFERLTRERRAAVIGATPTAGA